VGVPAVIAALEESMNPTTSPMGRLSQLAPVDRQRAGRTRGQRCTIFQRGRGALRQPRHGRGPTHHGRHCTSRRCDADGRGSQAGRRHQGWESDYRLSRWVSGSGAVLNIGLVLLATSLFLHGYAAPCPTGDRAARSEGGIGAPGGSSHQGSCGTVDALARRIGTGEIRIVARAAR